MKFGENLQNMRKAKKMSQEQLAEKVNVTRQSISKWERGEAYPTMNNIMTLCNIFHCNISDLVYEKLLDINSLDEEIKMNVVKFKKEKQRKMKGISKTIYVMARVVQIFVIVAMIVMAIVMVGIPMIISNTHITDTTLSVFGKQCEYEIKDKIFIVRDVEENREFQMDIDTQTNLQQLLTTHSKVFYIVTSEWITISIIGFMLIIVVILKYIEKLFVNIHHKDTPFTLENVGYIKKIAIYLIISVFLPTMTGLIFQVCTKIDMEIEFELMDIVVALIVFSLSYIFEYGYEIQLDSKGRMYGDENE